MDTRWQIEMLGWLRATYGDQVVFRFRTRKTAALLAYLAFHTHRSHPRDLLVELFWPESDPDTGRTCLRVALSSLRRQLEPPGMPPGAVILADRATVQLNPAACVTDVAQFEAAFRVAARATDDAERIARLTEAVALYRGELLPGFYESWLLVERERLAEAHLQALGHLVAHLEEAGDLPRALEYARRAVAADPLREAAHRDLIHLLEASGQADAARRQSEELAQIPARERGDLPSGDERAQPRAGIGSAARTVDSRNPAGTAFGASSAGLKPGDVPVARVPPARGGWLPLPLTRFFGREREIACLRELLLAAETRLVTLTGPGGSGKTRLAQEVAAGLREALDGSFWFVPLVDLADPRRVADQMRDALRLPRAPETDPLEQLVAFLSSQPSLLLLDNFEHLVEEGAPVVQALLERIAGLTVLVTSRRRLDLPGERDFPVLPLPTPDASPSAARRPDGPAAMQESLERLLECASVRLFVDRAQAVRPDFQLTASNAPAVAVLCARLEGLPLALELAATRIGVLTPGQMLARLEQRFELLARSGRATAGRHRSLRAALDWSYQLLSPELQRFFAQLCVFRGGWVLAAAEAVCHEPRALDYLEALRECSLVTAQEEGEQMRFRLLETIREYARECLQASGEAAEVERRHADFFIDLAERAEPELKGPQQLEWLDRLEGEHDNLRAALDWSFERGQVEVGLRLAGAAWRFWHARSYEAEGCARLAHLLARPEGCARTAVRAKALEAAAWLWTGLEPEGVRRARCEEMLAIGQELGNRQIIAAALNALGDVLRQQGDCDAAWSLLQENVRIQRELGDRSGISWSLRNLGHVVRDQGDLEAARSLYEESLALCQELGHRGAVATLLDCLARIAQDQGDLWRSRQLLEESLTIVRGMGARSYFMLHNLARIAHLQGDLQAARSRYEEILAIGRELGDERLIATAREGLASVGHPCGDDAETDVASCDLVLDVPARASDDAGQATEHALMDE